MWENQTSSTTQVVSAAHHFETTTITTTAAPAYTGFLFLIASSFLFGSNYVPVKQFETGDGMFFQFVLCIGVWLVGFVVYWIRQFPKFFALPMLGGFFWASGNVNSVPSIKTIGLVLSMLIWNVVGLVTGWATARFGWFGLEKDIPSHITLNYIGVALVASSSIFYLFVKPATSGKVEPPIEQKHEQVDISVSTSISSTIEKSSINQILNENNSRADEGGGDDEFMKSHSPQTKRIIGLVLAVFSGVMYGQYYTPVLYTYQHYNKGGNFLDMQFSFFTGILISSFLYFVIYCVVRKNNPQIFPRSILPALVSGIMWGVGTVCCFKATELLNQATSFPIASSGPNIFSSLWSILLYKEIKVIVESGNNSTVPEFVGFFYLIASSSLYGSNYIPVKQFETGDGMFFQFNLCMGIWIVGFFVNIIQGFPQFYALPMLGGFFWATGNVTSVPIIQTIGIGLGLLIWSFVALITSWASPRFGLFGLEKNVPSSEPLNYSGVALAALSVVMYLFVKSDPTRKIKPADDEPQKDSSKPDESKNEAKNNIDQIELTNKFNEVNEESTGFLEKQSIVRKRIIGSILAILSGVLYGFYQTPILYTDQQFNKDGIYMDMYFSFSTGTLVSALAYFVIYCALKKNKPIIYPNIFLPGLISGIMWGLATVCVFMAVRLLSPAIASPIECSGAPIVSSLWSIFLYKEIKGIKNLTFFCFAFALAVSGSVLIGLSM